MTPIVWNENTEAVPTGLGIGCSALAYSGALIILAIGDAPPQRKHERHESHGWTRHEADAGLRGFSRQVGWICRRDRCCLCRKMERSPPTNTFSHQCFNFCNYLSD